MKNVVVVLGIFIGILIGFLFEARADVKCNGYYTGYKTRGNQTITKTFSAQLISRSRDCKIDCGPAMDRAKRDLINEGFEPQSGSSSCQK